MDGKFQPTPPARTETISRASAPSGATISTHSAREDGDARKGRKEQIYEYFNPLRPRGRRLICMVSFQDIPVFQPTPPARTETKGAGLDVFSEVYFNPLRPRGRRQAMSYKMMQNIHISTHSAREDGDSNTTQKNKQFFITFPQSNHIILPQITANLPCTHPKPFSLCSFSGANPPVNSCLLLVRTKLFETSLPPAARSEYQRLFHFNPFTHPNMVHLCSVFISQVVKSKAVSLLINDICQYGF